MPGRVIQGHEAGGHRQPGVRARRDRQAGRRLPRRSVVGAARSARSRAERHLPRSLPRRRLRPVEGALHRHRQRRRSDPEGARRSHGGHPPGRLLRGGEARDRAAPRVAAPARGRRARRRIRSSSPTPTLRLIINDYTREAGLRDLERQIARIAARCARQQVEDREANKKSRQGHGDAGEAAQVPRAAAWRRTWTARPSVDEVGAATGLAWTPYGGEVLEVEAQWMPGTGSLILTGQLGEVMKESAMTALSYARARAASLGLKDGLLRRARDPHPRAGGRGAQGRAVGGRDHGLRAGVAAHRAAGASATWR